MEFLEIHINTTYQLQEDIQTLQTNQMAIATILEQVRNQIPPKDWTTICENALVGLDHRIDLHTEALRNHQEALESFQKDRLEVFSLSETDNN